MTAFVMATLWFISFLLVLILLEVKSMSVIKGHVDNLNALIDKIIAVKDSEVSPLFARITELELQLRNAEPELMAAIADKEAALLTVSTAEAATRQALADKGQLQADLDDAVTQITKLEAELTAALLVPVEGPTPVIPAIAPVTPGDVVATPVVDETVVDAPKG